jgi:hypothetical protein
MKEGNEQEEDQQRLTEKFNLDYPCSAFSIFTSFRSVYVLFNSLASGSGSAYADEHKRAKRSCYYVFSLDIFCSCKKLINQNRDSNDNCVFTLYYSSDFINNARGEKSSWAFFMGIRGRDAHLVQAGRLRSQGKISSGSVPVCKDLLPGRRCNRLALRRA